MTKMTSIFGYEIEKAKCNQIHTIHVEFGDPTYDEGEEDEEEDEEEEEDGDKGNLTTWSCQWDFVFDEVFYHAIY